MSWPIPGYSTVSTLGRGATGEVVRARHDASGQQVAIKYLAASLASDPAFLSDFRAEARLLTEVDDANLARLYEYIQSRGSAAIVLELVDGVPLRAILREHGAMTPEAALVVLKGSLLGLAAAHERGVVHRDYKPENVMVTRAGETKLIDFGIAVRRGRAATVAGTPTYMAPEQWDGAPASPAADVYAATCVLVECLTSRPPFVASSPNALRRQHHNAPPPFADVPKPLHGLVRAGLAKDTARRPADAREFVRVLDAAADDGYGADWEAKGRRELGRLAVLLAALFPLGGGGALSGIAAFALTVLGRRRVLAGVAALGAAAIGVGAASATTSRARSGSAGPTNLSATHTVGVPIDTTPASPPTPHRGTTPVAPGRSGPPPTTPAHHPRRVGPRSIPPAPPPIATARPAPPVTIPVPPPPPPSTISFQKFTISDDAGSPSTGDVYLVIGTDTTGPLTVYLEYSDGALTTVPLSGGTSYTITPRHAFPSCAGQWTVTAKSIPVASNQGATADVPC